jgi:hypothetical protein
MLKHGHHDREEYKTPFVEEQVHQAMEEIDKTRRERAASKKKR